VGGIAFGAVALVIGAILFRGFAENGFRLGSQLAWRYASLVFFAALVAGPLCRLAGRHFFQLHASESLGRKLVWVFAPAMASICFRFFCPMSFACRRAPP
jgi:hypothetical protein